MLSETENILHEVKKDRDLAIEQGMQLREKVHAMNRVITLAVNEQTYQEQESQKLIDELEEENKMLRNLLRISDQYSAPIPQKELN